MVDTRDLKSLDQKWLCGFESRSRHIKKTLLLRERFLFLLLRLVQSVSELGTSLELSNLLGSDLDLSLCCGVDTLTSGALSNCESTETNKSNLVTSNQSVLDSSYSSVKSLLRFNLGNAGTSGNLLN